MKCYPPSPLLICALVAMQIFGPAALWAAEERGIRIDGSRRAVIAAIEGASLTVQQGTETKAGQFRDEVTVGERLMTGDRTVADVLIGTRAVVTLGPGTTAQLLVVSDEQATIQVSQGLVRVAAAPSRLGSQEVVTVQTPTGQVQTRGGIVRVLVEAPVGKAEPVPTGQGKAYPASYAPERMAAVTSANGELIQVDEGTAEILGAGGKPVTIQAGQRVRLQAGQAGVIGEGNKPDSLRPGVVATQGHSQTPKEGREYLVALQVDQATKLGKALTGAAETGNDDSEKKKDSKNVINGATGGVNLASNTSLVNALFGPGGTADPAGRTPLDATGTGYGGNKNRGDFDVEIASDVKVRGNDKNSLLVFTRKDPVEAFVKEDNTLPIASNFGPKYTLEGESADFVSGAVCGSGCLVSHYYDALDPTHQSAEVIFDPKKLPTNVGFRSMQNPILSKFTVAKELVLIGGADNTAHGGVPPTDRFIIRGASSSGRNFTNLAATEVDLLPLKVNGLYPTDRDPADIGLFAPTPRQIVAANSTFLVENRSKFEDLQDPAVGGTLGQYSNLSTPSPNGIAITRRESEGQDSHVDGAITATGANVLLKGGVTLDQGTTATIGQTPATKRYFAALGATFTGSLMSVIKGPTGLTKLTMQGRMLGVYDGSIVQPDSSGGGKALLSVLDAKLVGPSGNVPLIDIAAGTHFDRDGKPTTPGSPPNVTVTSALVTRSTIQLDSNPLDNKLLVASAPLIALTQANMTTTSHFADLAGNQAQSLNLNGALVALNAANLVIGKGHLLNLNNATAAISGYLFSLTNGSGLDIKNGALFSLNDRSSLTLTGEAFGVFGSGSNTLTIENNLCAGPCGRLVNSANQPITTLEGIPLKVSGVTQDVVLPNGFNAFALAPGSAAPTTKIDIDANDALFHLDPTSTLTINGTQVK